MKPEERARQKIHQLLQDAGWVIQDHKDLNLGAALGVAVREFPVSTGYADYLLFVDRQAAGVIEAKPEGTTLTSAEYQSDKYIFSLPFRPTTIQLRSEKVPAKVLCPKCGNPMRVKFQKGKMNKRKPFYSCSRYPICKGCKPKPSF
jgi:hypothetical protein